MVAGALAFGQLTGSLVPRRRQRQKLWGPMTGDCLHAQQSTVCATGLKTLLSRLISPDGPAVAIVLKD
jgi:hypothetical protein